MQSTQKGATTTLLHVLNRVDAHAPLPLLGLAAGVLAGAAYTLESASHMVLPAATDLYIVGLLLAALGGIAGWLVGLMLRAPLVDGSGSGEESAAENGRAAGEAPINPPSEHDRE